MSVTNLTAPERETTITASDADDNVTIWTAQRTVITRLRKNPAFVETSAGYYGSSEWAAFTIPADRWSPAGVKRTRTMTDSQRREASDRLRTHRDARAFRGDSTVVSPPTSNAGMGVRA